MLRLLYALILAATLLLGVDVPEHGGAFAPVAAAETAPEAAPPAPEAEEEPVLGASLEARAHRVAGAWRAAPEALPWVPERAPLVPPPEA